MPSGKSTSLTLEPDSVVDDLQRVSHCIVLAHLHLFFVCGEQETEACQLGSQALVWGFSWTLAVRSFPFFSYQVQLGSQSLSLSWAGNSAGVPLCCIPQDGKPISSKGTLHDHPSLLLTGDFSRLVGIISGQYGLLLPLSQDNLVDREHRQNIPLMPAPSSPELYSISPGLHPQSPEDPDK